MMTQLARGSAGGRRWGVLLLILAAGLVPAVAAAQRPSVSYPVDHVVCDRLGRACYDPLGASVPLTKAHLGADAAATLERRIRNAGRKWNPNRFVLTTGVECQVEKKTCYVRAGSDEIDPITTEAQGITGVYVYPLEPLHDSYNGTSGCNEVLAIGAARFGKPSGGELLYRTLDLRCKGGVNPAARQPALVFQGHPPPP